MAVGGNPLLVNLHSNMDGLKTRLPRPLIIIKSHLHSNMDGLKTTITVQYELDLKIFTFQYGWIKNAEILGATECEDEFTFQYGWIKNENSSVYNVLKTLFTFQYGWIKNMLLRFRTQTAKFDLHSNMDGLKTSLIKFKGIELEEFTFQYGWIKNLNAYYAVAFHELFTFQYGWIKNAEILGATECEDEFTFQYGWIKNVARVVCKSSSPLFTFQYGWIKNNCQRKNYRKIRTIYIPIWMD